MFNYEWKMLLAALTICLAALFFTHAMASPSIACPSNVSVNECLGIPAYPNAWGGAKRNGVSFDRRCFQIGKRQVAKKTMYSIMIGHPDGPAEQFSEYVTCNPIEAVEAADEAIHQGKMVSVLPFRASIH